MNTKKDNGLFCTFCGEYKLVKAGKYEPTFNRTKYICSYCKRDTCLSPKGALKRMKNESKRL